MKHKTKLKLARKLLTQDEIKEHKPVFESEGWEKRKEKIKKIVKFREGKAKEAAKKRKDEKNKDKK